MWFGSLIIWRGYNMEQLNIKYFFPLTEQISLDLDYTPCDQYTIEKRQRELASMVGVASGSSLVSDGMGIGFTGTTSVTLKDPKLVIYPDSTPITIRTKENPSILARWVYKILGATWEKA